MRRGSGAKRRPGFKAAVIAAVALTAVAVGANVVAQQSDDDSGSEAPPGHPVSREPDEVSGDLITTGGSNFEPTVLTKFIPGTGFDPMQGDDAFADLVADPGENSTCVSADDMSAGSVSEFRAAVELPDGSRIKQIIFYGQDDALGNIAIKLSKTTVNVPILVGSDPTRSDAVVTSFSTLGETGVVVVASDDDLGEIVGSKSGGGVVGGTDHQFHQIRVALGHGAPVHVLCGVEVRYQVPVTGDPGTVFHPLSGYRAYDSRFEMAPVADGPLGAGPGRVIPVKDGRNVGTGVIDMPDAIPTNATAVAYTVTAASPTGSGFLFVAPGDASGITASNLNWDDNTSGAIANSGIVALDSSRQVIVFADGSSGANTQFIIDISGYFAPPDHPNMGN